MTNSLKTAGFSVASHTMNRIDINTGVEFEEFIAAFENAAPPFDPATLSEIAERGVGNHAIAETMFGHDPKIGLYAPLRLLIHADAEGNAVFTMDQPSPAFGTWGSPR